MKTYIIYLFLILPLNAFAQQTTKKDTSKVDVEGVTYICIKSDGVISQVQNTQNEELGQQLGTFCPSARIDSKAHELALSAIATLFSKSRLLELGDGKIFAMTRIDRQEYVKTVNYLFQSKSMDEIPTMEELFRLEGLMKRNVKFNYTVEDDRDIMCGYAHCMVLISFKKLLELKK